MPSKGKHAGDIHFSVLIVLLPPQTVIRKNKNKTKIKSGKKKKKGRNLTLHFSPSQSLLKFYFTEFAIYKQ